MKGLRELGIGAVLLLATSSAHAQLPWDAPLLLAPHAPRGISMVAAGYASTPGDGWGAVFTWRAATAPAGLGYHLVVGRGSGERDAIGAGIDASAWLSRASSTFPVDVIWTSGIGGAVGQSVQIALPVGFAAGRSIGEGSVWLNPYVASRIITEARFGGAAPDDELQLQLANEIGFNLAFDRERRFIVRAAASLGDRSAVALGIHVGGRPAALTSAR